MSFFTVINSYCKHAIKIVEACRACFGISLQNSFGVRICMARQVILISYIQVIINFSIEYNREMSKMHWLPPAFYIKDSQTMLMKLQFSLLKKSLLIRAAVIEIFQNTGNVKFKMD